MTARSIEAIVTALNANGVRYLIAGGLAVVAHGYVRLTADLDLILDLAPENVIRGLDALASLGYRPRAPVPLIEFADAGKRESWIREKNLTVFSLYSPEHPATEIDLFATSPLAFGPAYESAALLDVAPGIEAVFVGLDDLLRMKRQSARPQDLEDIARLNALRSNRRDG